jgi:hypothetical protein
MNYNKKLIEEYQGNFLLFFFNFFRYSQEKIMEYFVECINANPQWKIPSNIYWKDVIKIWIHWLLYYEDFRKYSRFEISKTVMSRLMLEITDIMKGFGDRWITSKTENERRTLSNNNLPLRFKGAVTCFWDGTHVPIKLPTHCHNYKEYHSYKLKTSTLNTQISTLCNGWIIWVSLNSLPAGANNDQRMINVNLKFYNINSIKG